MRSQSLSGIFGTAVARVVLVVIDVTSVDVVSLLSDVEGRTDVVLVASGDVDEVEVLEEVVLVQYVVVKNVLVSDASVSSMVLVTVVVLPAPAILFSNSYISSP